MKGWKRAKYERRAFVLFEVLLAVSILAGAITAFSVALFRLTELSDFSRREMEVQRVLDSALTDAAMVPVIQADQYDYTLEELGGVDIQVLIEPIEDLETEEGNLVTGLMRVQVTARFDQDGEEVERRAETWRYTRLYQ